MLLDTSMVALPVKRREIQKVMDLLTRPRTSRVRHVLFSEEFSINQIIGMSLFEQRKISNFTLELELNVMITDVFIKTLC